ncbi:MAG: AAA family ATPase [Pseudomonadota bacterium]
MILVGNRRGGAAELALHLLNVEENEHVRIHEITGFMSSDLNGAFLEAYGISRGTRCKKYLYSLSLSPPEFECVPIETFEAAIERIEKRLGFAGQPRAVVFHEKKGRRHAHVIWSRINSDTMTAIDPYNDKLSLNRIGHELFIQNGWMIPDGFRRKEDADPSNYTHAQHQQAKRNKRNPKELKRMFLDCWQQSDSKPSFANALREKGFVIARGDRRGFVTVDAFGQIFSISRWTGVKSNELKARLGPPEAFPSIAKARMLLGEVGVTSTNPVAEKLDEQQDVEALEVKRAALVETHRLARRELEEFLEARRLEEIKQRSSKIPTGLKSIWLRMSGGLRALQQELENESRHCIERDRAELQILIDKQLQERRELQQEILHLRVLSQEPKLLKADPAQVLIIPPEPDAHITRLKVQSDPTHILNVITDKQETFPRRAIVRALSDYIEDPFELKSAIEKVMQSNNLIEVEVDLVPRFSTRTMIKSKKELMDYVDYLSSTNCQLVSKRCIRSAIAHQNRYLQKTIGTRLSIEQKTAVRHCLDSTCISAIVGLAGAGKSTMLSAVRQACEIQGLRVLGAALSGKAADGLEVASGIESRTLASLQRSWENGFDALNKDDVLIIDEAGMIGTDQMKIILQEVKNSGAKVILVGDPEQLQPINAGTPFREIAAQLETFQLTEIHRQKKKWQRQASLDFAEQRTEEALNAYEVNGNITIARDVSEAIFELVTDYMKDCSRYKKCASRLALAYRRKEVFAINQAIRAAKKEFGELFDEVLISTKHGPRAFAPKDRILFTKNDHSLGIRNGSIGNINSVSKTELKIEIVDGVGGKPDVISINPKLYNALDHGYAVTIHKSQGVTVDHAYVLGSHHMDRHLTYVAMTRHRENVKLYGDRVGLKKMRSVSSKEATNSGFRKLRSSVYGPKYN